MRSLVAVLLLAAFAWSAADAGTVRYDSPARNYIIGIDNLNVTGTSNDDVYDVRFRVGSLNDVFGAGAMTVDLTFDLQVDAAAVVTQMATVLNGASPNDLVGGPLFGGSSLIGDAFVVPFRAGSTFDGHIGIFNLAQGNFWQQGGTTFNRDRSETAAPWVCPSCAPAKFAVFRESEDLIPPPQIPVPAPALLLLSGLFALGLAGRRYRSAG